MTRQSFERDWERHVNEFLAEPIPRSVASQGHRTVVDVLSAAVAGSETPGVKDVSTDAGFSSGTATILGTGRRVAPGQAALLNTAAAISQEIEEGHNEGGHVGASIVAGGLPMAESEGMDGASFVETVVKVYEITARMEYALFAMKDRINQAIPWLLRDPHSTWTTVGPALVSARALDADPGALKETFRIASNLAVVSMHDPYVEGPPARNFTAGFSAQAGVTAAQTAVAGLSGSKTAIGVVYDPFETLLETGDFTTLFESLGDRWWITESYNKPYPSCRYTHPALDALRDIEGIDAIDTRTIEHIHVETFSNAADLDHATPSTLTGAKFSIPYVLARYLESGAIELAHFEPDAIREDAVQKLAARVDVDTAREFDRRFPENWSARVTVQTADGQSSTAVREYPRGDYRDSMTDDEFEARTRRLLDWGLDDDVDEALEALFALPNRSVESVVRLL